VPSAKVVPLASFFGQEQDPALSSDGRSIFCHQQDTAEQDLMIENCRYPESFISIAGKAIWAGEVRPKASVFRRRTGVGGGGASILPRGGLARVQRRQWSWVSTC
jgi:hypothetical protein